MDEYDISNQEWEGDLRQLRLRLAAAAAFLIAVTLMGVMGYKLLAPASSWVDAFYMTAITLTTVGFGEVIDLQGNPAARLFTVVLILVGMGGVLYFVSTATAFVLEGQLTHVFWRRRMEKTIAAMSDHLVVCGSGGTAFYAADELASVQRPIVMVTADSESAARFRQTLTDTPIVVGDPASDEALEAAGIQRAAGLVVCTDNDKENLVITLTARQLAPGVRIVARVADVHITEKIRKAGADAVVAPTFIGGLRMASELIRPNVVDFLDTMLRDRDLNLRIDEVEIPETSFAVGRTLVELDLDMATRALLVAIRYPDGSWLYNPKGNTEVTPGVILVFLGSPDDLAKACEAVEGSMLAKPKATSRR